MLSPDVGEGDGERGAEVHSHPPRQGGRFPIRRDFIHGATLLTVYRIIRLRPAGVVKRGISWYSAGAFSLATAVFAFSAAKVAWLF